MKNDNKILDIDKHQLMKKFRVRFMGSILKSSGKRIPSITKFEIETQDFNEYLLSIGIKHKLPPRIKFEKNDNSSNRYIGHQIIRLRKARANNNTDLFGHIAMFCLRSSKAFRVSAINHVIPNWGFGISTRKLFQINRGVNGIFRDLPDEMNFKRVYIPKKVPNKGRPLGVPTIEGRIALHMLNNMNTLGFENDMLPSQHAYLPGRGCHTAGKEVIDKAREAKNIYETDIRSFFDRIHQNYLEEILINSGMKKRIVYGLMNLNLSHPKLPKELLNDESYHIEAKRDEDNLREGNPLDQHSKMMKAAYEFIEANGGEITIQLMKEDGCESLEEWVQLQGALFDSYKPAKVEGHMEGVAQGSPTSPFLAILGIRKYLAQNPKVNFVNYADDQIFYSNDSFEISDMPEIGIKHAEEKCGGIKKDGKGLKELKFLGLIYNGETNTLRSETRTERGERIKGSLIELWEEMEGSDSPANDYLKKMADKNFFGFVLSSLYIGSGDIRSFPTKARKVNKLSYYGKYVISPTLSSELLKALGYNLRLKTVRKLLLGKK